MEKTKIDIFAKQLARLANAKFFTLNKEHFKIYWEKLGELSGILETLENAILNDYPRSMPMISELYSENKKMNEKIKAKEFIEYFEKSIESEKESIDNKKTTCEYSLGKFDFRKFIKRV